MNQLNYLSLRSDIILTTNLLDSRIRNEINSMGWLAWDIKKKNIYVPIDNDDSDFEGDLFRVVWDDTRTIIFSLYRDAEQRYRISHFMYDYNPTIHWSLQKLYRKYNSVIFILDDKKTFSYQEITPEGLNSIYDEIFQEEFNVQLHRRNK